MIVIPTQKLYFNKFIYVIKFNLADMRSYPSNNLLIKQIKKQLKDKNIDYKTRLDWKFTKGEQFNITLSAYLNDKATYEEFLNRYPTIISKTHCPINDKHKDMLQDKIEIIVRKKLLYNKFKYKIILKTGYGRQNAKEIQDWISTAFEGRTEGQTGDYLVKGSWMISLYLTNQEDLMQVRLCLSEHITNLIRVETFEDNI